MANPDAQPSKAHEEKLDDALDDSFPASDPPSNTPQGGTRKSKEIEDAHAAGEHVPNAMPTDDRHATETAGARQHGSHPAESDDRG